jgi:histidinol-phosphate phosphatase family protein
LKAIFFDRDGVIIRKAPEGEYIARWEQVQFLQGALDGVSTLYRAGFKIFIVTNQRGVALGKIRLDDLEEIHRRMRATLGEAGASITGIYFCPHAKHDNCSCRKPAPGMLLRASDEHKLDLKRSWMIGDSPGDIAAGNKSGCKTVLISASIARGQIDPRSDLVSSDLSSAATQILNTIAVHEHIPVWRRSKA